MNTWEGETMPYADGPISNRWEVVAMFAVFEREGICTTHDLSDLITDLRHQTPRLYIEEAVVPTPYVVTNAQTPLIDNVLEMLHTNGLIAPDVTNISERLQQIIGMSERIVQTMIG